MRALAAIVLVLVLSAPGPAPADPATPQRPSFSSDTSTTVAGSIELDAGFGLAEGDQRNLPLLLKFGVRPGTELFAGYTPFVQVAEEVNGPGDLLLGVRHRFHAGESLSAALQGAAKLPTADADEGLGSGEPDLSAALSLAAPLPASVAAVGFYQLTAYGQEGDRGFLVEHALALALGAPLAEAGVSAFLEGTGFWRPEIEDQSALLLAGLAYAIRPAVVIDLAAGLHFDEGDETWMLLAGFTSNFGRVRP